MLVPKPTGTTHTSIRILDRTRVDHCMSDKKLSKNNDIHMAGRVHSQNMYD